MNKPEDIPQSAWDLAAHFMEKSYPYGAKEFAARAIMAEREACAALSEKVWALSSEDTGGWITYSSETRKQGKKIADAIRNRP